MAINFVKNDDIRILRDIEQYYSTQIDEMPMNGTSRPITCLLLEMSQLRTNSQPESFIKSSSVLGSVVLARRLATVQLQQAGVSWIEQGCYN